MNQDLQKKWRRCQEEWRKLKIILGSDADSEKFLLLLVTNSTQSVALEASDILTEDRSRITVIQKNGKKFVVTPDHPYFFKRGRDTKGKEIFLTNPNA